jgi:uncharacterized protein (DUF362 family)
MYKVSITRVVQGNLQEAVYGAMDLINWKDRIKKHGRVVIKPNMGNLTYVPAIVTCPEIVYHVVKYVRTQADEVIVGESDGMRYSCDDAFEKTGIKEAVERAGGRIVNLSRDDQIPVKIHGLHWKELALPRTIVEADSFISIPVIKTHETTTITCAIKNQFGCIGDRYRILNHRYLHEILADINLGVHPDLVITDGTICMEGNGPIHGPTKELGIIMASDNVLANDLVATQVMKFDYRKIKHLANAIRLGLGPSSIDQISIEGVPLSDFADVSFEPVKLDIVARTLIVVSSNRFLTRTLLLSPLFNLLNNIAWSYRTLRGRERRV